MSHKINIDKIKQLDKLQKEEQQLKNKLIQIANTYAPLERFSFDRYIIQKSNLIVYMVDIYKDRCGEHAHDDAEFKIPLDDINKSLEYFKNSSIIADSFRIDED